MERSIRHLDGCRIAGAEPWCPEQSVDENLCVSRQGHRSRLRDFLCRRRFQFCLVADELRQTRSDRSFLKMAPAARTNDKSPLATCGTEIAVHSCSNGD